MNYLSVKNWSEFQHYKDRSPPWIKLHRDLLRDYDFICLQDASKMHLMLIWLLASQLDNKIPNDEEFIRSQIGVKGKINLSDLIDKGFIVLDSNTLADCKQDAIPEAEAEAYSKETEKLKQKFDKFYEVYGKPVDKKQAVEQWKKKATTIEIADKIIEVAAAYAKSRKQEYRKSPMRWLRDENWNDVIEFPKSKLSERPEDFDNVPEVSYAL